MANNLLKIKSLSLSEQPASSEHAREEKLFQSLDVQNKGFIIKKQLIDALRLAGIQSLHSTLKPVFEKLDTMQDSSEIDFKTFVDLTKDNLTLVENALTGSLVIPDFPSFCKSLDEIYEKVASIKSGKVATYIPQLARENPNLFGVSVCTIDGQVHSIGDSSHFFSVQSTCKPINYCIAQQEHGEKLVHKYIGKEPSGHRFDVLQLNKDNIPHNPFINAGAIMACSLIRRDLDQADRFDHIMQIWQELCGGLKPGFNNAVYLSEKNTADRNYAITYFMQEKKAFMKDTRILDVLDFYFQCCSIEVTTLHMSIVAATMANSGVCPLTQKHIFDTNTVKNCLSLMDSCGLYDFSGEFAFTVGLPAKSGVSGAIMIVVPNVLGMCIWSPPLDHFGNSVRGVAFAKELVKKFNFHNYDSIVPGSKEDPRFKKNELKLSGLMSLIWAASQGDILEMQRLLATGVDFNEADYDGRTALHLAASEGQLDAVQYLLQHKAKINPVDRWGGTPYSDASHNKHLEVMQLLKKYGGK
jgi:glutaminase